MGQIITKILNHPMPIDHKGKFTSYNRLYPRTTATGTTTTTGNFISSQPILQSKLNDIFDDTNNIFVSNKNSNQHISTDFKSESKEEEDNIEFQEKKTQPGFNNNNNNNGNQNTNNINDINSIITFGQVLLATWLGVLSIVAALSLQSAITYCFKQMISTNKKGWKIFILFLQFFLVFSLLIFFAVFFAG